MGLCPRTRAHEVFSVLPPALRDAAYKVVAEYRYAIFGQKAQCMKPSGDFKRRFLEYDPREDEDARSPFKP